MKRTVQPQSPSGDGEPTVSLQLIENSNASTTVTEQGSPDQRPQRVYMVTLQPPRNGSGTDRRLRLRHNLSGGDASANASILARDPHFWEYLHQINLMAYDDEIDTRRSRHFINRACGVSGRHEFEHCPDAALRYFALIEEPFLDWLLTDAAE
jgi:hypothetical protein